MSIRVKVVESRSEGRGKCMSKSWDRCRGESRGEIRGKCSRE